MFVDECTEPAAHIVGELLPISGELDRPIVIKWISQMEDLSIREIVEPEPLNVEEATEAIEGVQPLLLRSSYSASHQSVALKGVTPVHREDEDHRWRREVSVIQLLLVLPLCGPEAVPHGLDNVLFVVARDDEVAGPIIVNLLCRRGCLLPLKLALRSNLLL